MSNDNGWRINVPLTKGLNQDQFLDLMEAVENEGGELISGPCRGRKTELKNVDGLGRPVSETVKTTGCGNESRFMVIVAQGEGQDGGVAERPAICCAVDDAMHLWPRYKGKL